MQGASKVGALLIVFVGLLILAYSLLGHSLIPKKTHTFYAEFQDAAGLTPGAAVLMAGVQIGSVEAVDLSGPTTARLTMAIDGKYSIPRGSTAQIPASLVNFGEPTLLIVAPPGDHPALEELSVLRGLRPGPLEGILPNAKDTVAELNKTLASVRKLLEDGQLKANLNGVIEQSSKTLRQFGDLATQAQRLVAENRTAIGQAVRSASLAMDDIQKATAMVTKLVKDGKLQQQTASLLDHLNTTTARASKLVADLDAFVNDPQLRGPLATTMSNAADISATGKKVATNAEAISANGVTVSAKAIELANKAGEIEDEARELVKKLSKFVDHASLTHPPQIGATMDLMRETKPNYWRTDLNFSMPFSDWVMHAGVYDAFEANRINAQVGKAFGKGGEFRYGIYASKPGMGVDYRLAPDLSLRADLFDINDPRFDLRARYMFRPGVFAWLGVDRVFKNNAATIGVGVSK